MEIIIIRFNQKELEENCIRSVKKFTDLKNSKLTIYNNYPNNINLGKLWNNLIRNSKQDIICLLNSDTLVEKGWERITEILENKKVGAVGSITNNCGGNQKNLGRGEPEEINDLSGFCYLFRKEVWKEVGEFPEDMPFYGQETVFNRKLEDRGYKLMVDRRVYVHHYKGQSWLKAKEAGEVSIDQRDYGKFHYLNFVERLKRVQKLPRDIVILGSGKGNPFPTFQGIDQFISDFGGRHLSMEATLEDIGSPEVLIVAQSRYEKEWFEKIKEVKAKKALYFMDLRKDWECTDLSMFDKIFLCAKEYVNHWQKRYQVPVEWLPQATIQHPVPLTGKHNELVHIGGLDEKYHSNRIEVIRELAKHIKVTQLNETERDKRAELVERSWELYAGADFSLAVSPNVGGYTSDRVYHIMGSGGCLLSYDPGGLSLGNGLWFKTIEEAIELLKTPKDERDKIKKQAFDFIQSNHLYKPIG